MKFTDEQYKALQEIIQLAVDEGLDRQLTEKLKYIPSKSEFYESMDRIMSELKAIREELTVVTGKVYDDNEDRITTLEKNFRLQFAN
jgi:hypothetical protein